MCYVCLQILWDGGTFARHTSSNAVVSSTNYSNKQKWQRAAKVPSAVLAVLKNSAEISIARWSDHCKFGRSVFLKAQWTWWNSPAARCFTSNFWRSTCRCHSPATWRRSATSAKIICRKTSWSTCWPWRSWRRTTSMHRKCAGLVPTCMNW